MNNFVNTSASFVVYNKNALLIMARMKVTPRLLILEDKVYRQILHAEVIFQLFLDLFKLSAVCGKCLQGQMNMR